MLDLRNEAAAPACDAAMVRGRRVESRQVQKRGVVQATTGPKARTSRDHYTFTQSGVPAAVTIRRVIFLMMLLGLSTPEILAAFPGVS